MMGGLRKEGCNKGGGWWQVEGEGCRQGDVENDNSWAGGAIHEIVSPFIKGAARKNELVSMPGGGVKQPQRRGSETPTEG